MVCESSDFSFNPHGYAEKESQTEQCKLEGHHTAKEVEWGMKESSVGQVLTTKT